MSQAQGGNSEATKRGFREKRTRPSNFKVAKCSFKGEPVDRWDLQHKRNKNIWLQNRVW